MPRFIIILFFALLTLMEVSAPSALAADPLLCRTVDSHQVCILSIKRSAKNFWEYRVQLSVDDQPRAKERYDCRRTLRSMKTQEAPSPQQLHHLVCGLLQR
jgi:hypothetical protein